MAETEHAQSPDTVTESAEQKKKTGTQPEGMEAGDNSKPAGRRKDDGTQSSGKAKSKGSKSSNRRTGGSANTRKSKKAGSASRQKHKSTTQTIAKSFGHAFDGIFAGLEERNMKIHCTMAALVAFFGLILHISVTEWCICFVLFGLIMGLELVNTAIEALCDLVTQEYKPLAKRAKDTAAGAVLIASIMAATAGLIIFIPRLLYVLRSLWR